MISYFLCLDAKKVTKKNQGWQIILGLLVFRLSHALQLVPLRRDSNSNAFLRPALKASKQSLSLHSGSSQNNLRPFEIQKLASYLTPHTSHLTPHASRLTPHASHLTPDASPLASCISKIITTLVKQPGM